MIEAVPEKLDLKISTFGDLSKLAPKDAVLGSNSSSYKSSMMLERVDEDSKKRILNTHYGMPPLNRTVELMTDRFTDPAVLEFMVVVHNAVGLMPAVARKESTGFVNFPCFLRSDIDVIQFHLQPIVGCCQTREHQDHC